MPRVMMTITEIGKGREPAMKRLWKTITPCMSDILGLQALMNNTSGIALVDDASS